jgi:murein DD-endopeptidase MepM/ murein hydrolase activator NlpD
LASLAPMLVFRPLAAALSALVLALSALALTAPAAPAEDLQAQLEAKESKLDGVRERKGVLTSTIAADKARLERLIGEVAAIRTREAGVRERLGAKEAELAVAVRELGSAKGRLDRARDHLRHAIVILRERLIAIYETGTPDLLSVLVEAADVSDIATQAAYLNQLHRSDEAVVERVGALRDSVRGIVDRRRGAEQTIESARDTIASQARELVSTRRRLRGHREELVAARAARLASLSRVSAHEEELDGSVEDIQGQIAAEIAATGSAPLPAGPIQGGSGGLIWPVDGPIASGFGSRTINGSSEYHPGIDIAVPEGTPIRAALGGTVIFTEPESSSGGYGNYTCLDHGGGLSTCYAHQSAFAVSAGDSVSQGEVIGYTGCIGYCLGPHLHFEVRINGTVTDPMGYL